MEKTKSQKLNKTTMAIVLIVFVLYSLTLLYPLYFILLNSFKRNGEFLENIYSLPSIWKVENYTKVFVKYNFYTMFVNSALLSVLGTAICTFFTTVTAYIFARYDFFCKNLLWTVIIAIMLIPSIGTLSATYTIMFRLRLSNKLLGVLVLYSGPFSMNFLLLTGFFKGISRTYVEAAKIDGAGNCLIMFKVMLPQARNGVFTIALLLFLGFWNDYMTPYIYLTNTPTLAVGVQDMSVNATSRGEYTEMFAGMVIALIPIVIVYCAFQKYILEATMTGGLKG